MSYQPKDMTGSLFRNDRKERENQPDMTGELTIEGVAYRLAGWTKDASTGRRFLSLKATRKDDGGM